eukprot:TRINITY_DN67089_c0_g1_i1.p1 TRINITY_DN67089_c0_g1~~TRINITY_DN67089_c0_g1_i1.p1  ORF type:complete len:469 (+),score=64.47 TRINITY_DN67089_c0_g1_i1:145-1551(+)
MRPSRVAMGCVQAPKETGIATPIADDERCDIVAKFAVGKMVVVDPPRAAGPPWDDFKGRKCLVKSTKRSTEGTTYTVLYKASFVGLPPADGNDDAQLLEDVPEKWLRRHGTIAQSSDVKHLPLDRVFKACHTHKIPVFQRRYCWTESQWIKLWNTIVSVRDNQNLSNHSLGRLMLFQQTDGARLILDGQQRCTTLLLLLSALRNRLVLLGADKSQDIEELCSLDRFIPTLDDREDFKRCMDETSPQGSSSIVCARRVFDGLCAPLDADLCEETADAVLNRLSATCFVIDNVDQIQSVFERLAEKAQLVEQFVGTEHDLNSCVLCYSEGDGGTIAVSTHWGPNGERLCSECACKQPGSEVMTPGMPMVPVDLVRNFVLDHFQNESTMRSMHARYWSQLEAKYNDSPALENAFIAFLEKRDVVVSGRWALFASFVRWWRAEGGTSVNGGTDTCGAEAHATQKLEAMLEGI